MMAYLTDELMGEVIDGNDRNTCNEKKVYGNKHIYLEIGVLVPVIFNVINLYKYIIRSKKSILFNDESRNLIS